MVVALISCKHAAIGPKIPLLNSSPLKLFTKEELFVVRLLELLQLRDDLGRQQVALVALPARLDALT